MDTRWKVKILSPQLKNLSKRQQGFCAAITNHLEHFDLQVLRDTPSRANIYDRYKIIRDCDGILILAFEQWEGRRIGDQEGESEVLPSEFTHIGIVQAVLSGRPYLILRERSLSDRGALRKNYADAPIDMPRSLSPEWLRSDGFKYEFDGWLKKVKRRAHVFLGYSSQAAEVANLISRFLTEKLKLRVCDWHNFPPAESVWDSIERAEKSTNCGIFLFMADDVQQNGASKQFAPRDNVVFEAGYFAGSKQRSRSLIVREQNAKMPTDFGGILYLSLDSRKSIAGIETKLSEYIENMLGGAD